MSRNNNPLILALTGDYFFIPRLEDAASALGYELEVVEAPSAFGADDMKAACQGVLSELAAEGVQLLNSGDYYEAHESLEHAWLEASELEGYLYRTLLQVSVAYLHVEKGNYAGAVKMLLRVRQWLDPLPDQCRGVDAAALQHNVEAFAEAVQQAGESGLSELDHDLLKPIPLIA